MNPSGPEMTCAACREDLREPYFAINGTILCAACRGPIERQLRGKLGLAGLGRALLFGLGGSAIGIGIYLGLPVLSGVEVSLLAVMVGYAIGVMVRRGGGGFGGLGCRIIAVGLTYASLGVGHLGVEFLTIGPERQVELPVAPTPADIPAMIGLAIEMPLLRIRWSPSHVLIIGFALWQAWRLNRPRRFIVDGPHQPGGAAGPVPPRDRDSVTHV